MRDRSTSRTMLAGAALSLMLMAMPAVAVAHEGEAHGAVAGDGEGRAWSELDDVRAATGAYHSLDAALADGFVPFDPNGSDVALCFDSDAGGMGVHYVRNIDDSVSVTDPEAMVYELTPDGQHRLVAVEYIVPEGFVEDEAGEVVALPQLFGIDFHKHGTLPVYILHAWAWEDNPAGTFADFNPVVSACPTA